MITESFLNSCFKLILCKKSNIKKTIPLYRDMLEVLSFKDGKENIEIPVIIQTKLECLEKMIHMLVDGKSIETIIDSISFSNKFDQFRNFLDSYLDNELKDHESADILKQVRMRKKIGMLFQNYDQLDNVLESIKDGSFESIDDLIDDYEATIKQLFSNVMESNRNITVEAAASLDMNKDDYSHVLELIKDKYNRENKTPTGFPILDNNVLFGGFDPTRLYIFGGSSGSGKSAMLANLIVNSANDKLNLMNQTQKKRDKKVYIYITLENLIDETFMRMYQAMFSKYTNDVLRDISSNIDIGKAVKNKLDETNSVIIMKYFPAMSISSTDLMGVLDEAIEEYGKENIMGLYIDYLDLLKTDIKYDIYRMELGYITLSLKTLAVMYNIPVVTATQLSRASYDIEHASDLNLIQMSESIKKVEHADFVCLIGKDKMDPNTIHANVGKNRSGQSNFEIDFKVDFGMFKFINGTKVVNSNKQDQSNRTNQFVKNENHLNNNFTNNYNNIPKMKLKNNGKQKSCLGNISDY